MFSICCKKKCLFLVHKKRNNLILNVVEQNCVRRPNLLSPTPLLNGPSLTRGLLNYLADHNRTAVSLLDINCEVTAVSLLDINCEVIALNC